MTTIMRLKHTQGVFRSLPLRILNPTNAISYKDNTISNNCNFLQIIGWTRTQTVVVVAYW